MLRRATQFRLLCRAAPSKRRKIAVVRLGGGRRRGGRRLFIGLLRRLRLRWLASQYRRAVRRLRKQYAAILRDVLDGAAAHSRVTVDSACFAAAAPFMPVAPSCNLYYCSIR
uniref:Uncharacterized protein n=1 Tax=Ananas comosus var. bracteatus TaxID=296719 RepID=A0A6V7P610_ANACO|nr:unnamed protein product [Ananas comosus var. bracteatus]